MNVSEDGFDLNNNNNDSIYILVGFLAVMFTGFGLWMLCGYLCNHNIAAIRQPEPSRASRGSKIVITTIPG